MPSQTGVENISAPAARVWRGQRSAPYGPRLILKAFCRCDLLTKLQSALAVPSATVTFDGTRVRLYEVLPADGSQCWTPSSIPDRFVTSEAPSLASLLGTPQRRHPMVRDLVIIMASFLPAQLLTQSPPAAAPAAQQAGAASSPAKSIGMFAYPKNEQSADQQLKDENECFASAKQQSGIDPQAPPPATKTEEQKKAEQQAAADNAKQAKGGRVKGAARGAAGGAAVGAIADDDAGTGAAAGATAGTMVGGAKQRRANKAAKQQAAQATAQQQQQEEAQAKATYQQGIDTFKRAFSACMDARGYSIK